MCALGWAAGANFTTVLHEHGCCANASARADALAFCAQNGLDVIIKTDAAGGGPGWDQVNSARFWIILSRSDGILRGAGVELLLQPPISTSPAFLGVNVKDEPEPSDSEFRTLRRMTDEIHAKAPGKLAFINM